MPGLLKIWQKKEKAKRVYWKFCPEDGHQESRKEEEVLPTFSLLCLGFSLLATPRMQSSIVSATVMFQLGLKRVFESQLNLNFICLTFFCIGKRVYKFHRTQWKQKPYLFPLRLIIYFIKLIDEQLHKWVNK